MLTLLVIDDEKAFSDLIVNYFNKTGCAVSAVASGEEGVALLEKTCPDIIIVDNKLPGIGGVETVKRLRALRPEVCIMMVSIDKEADVRADLAGCRIEQFFKKPVMFSVFCDAVVGYIARARKKEGCRA